MELKGDLEICENCGWYSGCNGPVCSAPLDFMGMPSIGGGCEHFTPRLRT